MKTTRLISILGIVSLLSCCEEKAKDTALNLSAENAKIKNAVRDFGNAAEAKVQHDTYERYIEEMLFQVRCLKRRNTVLIGVLSLDGRQLNAKQIKAWNKVLSASISDDTRDSDSFARWGSEGYSAPYALASVLTEITLAEKAAIQALRLEHTHQKLSMDSLKLRGMSNDHMSKVFEYLETASAALDEDLKKAPVR